MGMKQYAITATNEELTKAARAFGECPSAINWSWVSRTMKAHQIANFEADYRLEQLLSDVPRSRTVNVLAAAFDLDVAELARDMKAGLAKLASVA